MLHQFQLRQPAQSMVSLDNHIWLAVGKGIVVVNSQVLSGIVISSLFFFFKVTLVIIYCFFWKTFEQKYHENAHGDRIQGMAVVFQMGQVTKKKKKNQ